MSSTVIMSPFRREHNGVPAEAHRSLILGSCVENGLPYPMVIPFSIKSVSVGVCTRNGKMVGYIFFYFIYLKLKYFYISVVGLVVHKLPKRILST